MSVPVCPARDLGGQNIKKGFGLGIERNSFHPKLRPQSGLLLTDISLPLNMTTTFDHVLIGVDNDDLPKYKAVLATIDWDSPLQIQDSGTTILGFGKPRPVFWVRARAADTHTLRTHVAFTVKNREQVANFHAEALKVGWTSNGEPGVRAQYSPYYYAAYVLDDAGNNFEAVCHEAPAE